MSTPKFDDGAFLEKVYEFSGRLISVRAADEKSARVPEEFLKGYHLTKLSATSSRQVSCRLDVLSGNPPPLPPNLHAFDVPHGFCFGGGGDYFLLVEKSRIDIGPPSRGLVTIWLGETVNERKPVAITNVMAYALQALLRRCDLYDFHAAGVVEPRTGTCFLFAGPSNSGKSTLTLRLLESGWKYLTDDMVVLDETARGVEARGLRRLFSVSARTLEGCSMPRLEEALGAPAASDPTKRRLDPEIVFPDSHAGASVPAVLCFPTLTGDETSRVEPVGKTEAMSLLIKYNPWAGYDVASGRGHLRALGSLVKQSRTVSLLAGRDLLSDPSKAHALLSAHAAP